MVFFIANYRVVPINTITGPLVACYFGLAAASILHLIMTLRPRLRRSPPGGTGQVDKLHREDPLFFAGIREFKDFPAFRKSMEELVNDEAVTSNVYMRELYSLAHINSAKYKHLQTSDSSGSKYANGRAFHNHLSLRQLLGNPCHATHLLRFAHTPRTCRLLVAHTPSQR